VQASANFFAGIATDALTFYPHLYLLSISDLISIDGGQVPMLGDVSLPHHAILFIDKRLEGRHHASRGCGNRWRMVSQE
jgi:hypothetical protein